MNLNNLKYIHLTGIKGVGMTAIALCLQDIGIRIDGSDTAEYFVTDDILKKRKIDWHIGLSAKNINNEMDLVVTTAAHGGLANPEVKAAQKKKIPVITYAEMLAELASGKETVCVCGVGGKTTTSSMITVLLDSAKMDPSFAIGVGNIFPLGVPGKYSREGKYFVCEADEYAISPGINNNPKFSLLNPKVVVVTNIEYDHPDIYPSFEDTKRVFEDFFKRIPKFSVLIACIDNENVAEMVKDLKINVIKYGFSKDADFQIKNIRYKNEKTFFDVLQKKGRKLIKDLSINVPGRYNVQNATAAMIVANFYQVDEIAIKEGLNRYLGCRRRFEEMPHYLGASFYDDYAHHPDEIRSILGAAREWFPKRKIIAVFQPHTYSRTKSLFKEFSQAFVKADQTVLMDIYSSAREIKDNSISSKMLADECNKYKKGVEYTGDHLKTLNWLKKNVKRNDVVITMGAGDIFHLYREMKENAE